MIRFVLPVILLLLLRLPAIAQYEIKLKFEKDLPKELFAAPTAVLVSYATNAENPEIEKLKFEQLKSEFGAYSRQLGLHVVTYSDYENAANAALAQQLEQLGVSQLIFLNEVEIVAHGAQDTYRLLITKFNQKSGLISENQKAFALQGADLEQILQRLSAEIAMYPKSYFKENPNKKDGYEAALAISNTIPENEQAAKEHPKIILSPEDLQRGDGGAQKNFFFRVEGDMEYINAGFLGQKLRPFASQNAASLRYLNKYRAGKWAFAANKAVMFGALIGYAQEVSRDYTDYFNDRQKIYLGVAAASLIGNHFITKKTNFNFKRAVDEYNVWAESRLGQSLNRFSPAGMQLGFVPVSKSGFVAPSVSVYWNLGRPSFSSDQ